MKTTTKPKYRWKLAFGNPDKDHSYWLDQDSGRISLKDESGDLPHQADDGVLWLDKNRSLVAHRHDGKTYVSIPLTSEKNNEETSSITSVSKAIRLAERFHMKLVFKDVFAMELKAHPLISAARKGEDLVISFS